jgi:ABC-type antimicrobial peptide transport system permease subunit
MASHTFAVRLPALSLAAGAATLAAAAVLANLVPTLRAASVDPIAALRVD